MARKVIVLPYDGGFFCIFIALFSYLVSELSEDPNSIVLPDWRVSKMKPRFPNGFTNFCYGREEDGNIWLKLFEPLPFPSITEKTYQNEDLLYQNASLVADDWNFAREPLLTQDYGYWLYRDENFTAWRHHCHYFFQRYIHPRPLITERVKKIAAEHFNHKKIIGVLVRHPSHGREQPNGIMPRREDFLAKIHQTLSQYEIDHANFILFVVTDQQSTIDYFTEHFPAQIAYDPDAHRVTLADDKQFQQLPKAEQAKIDGYQIQQMFAKDPMRWHTNLAAEIIANALLLAKCDYFIHTNSNIAKAVAYMNPRTHMIFCDPA